ncbi:MAG: acyltransferase family protein [Alphaproteobacteria bacterium]|nr:acyltransferase family protein [Alphaproteobacteria bacterium]
MRADGARARRPGNGPLGAKRLAYIETMRGLACLLLVSWHIVGERPTDGLHLALDHPLHQVGEFFLPLRMPLFSFISGFVFAAAMAEWGAARGVIATKARRLLLPLVCVGTLHFLLRSAAYGHDLHNIWKVYLTGYEHFWFLQATFLIMAALTIANVAMGGRALAAALVCMAIAVPLYPIEMNLDPNWFSITKVFYLAPFFLLGQIFRTAQVEQRIEALGPRRMWLLLGTGALIIGLVALRETGALGRGFALHSAPMLLLSLSLCTFFFALRWRNSWLAMIGPYSYAIYLFHVMFTAGFRFFEVNVVHEQSPYVIWALSMIVGVAGPIIVALALKRAPPVLETMLLGVRYARRPPPVVSAPGTARAPEH